MAQPLARSRGDLLGCALGWGRSAALQVVAVSLSLFIMERKQSGRLHSLGSTVPRDLRQSRAGVSVCPVGQAQGPGKVWAGGLASGLLLVWSVRLCRIEFDFSPLLRILVADSCYQHEVLTFYFECMSSGSLITSKCPRLKAILFLHSATNFLKSLK